MDLTFDLIDTITNNFSEDQKVGSGVYGDVYKAVYNGKEVALKKLHPLQQLDDKELHRELLNLTKVSHKNVVQLIGYCYETRYRYIKYYGETIMAKQLERVLCFEYMEGESLEVHINDESCDLNWPTCYNIIRGTCDGLNHLHSALENPIFHLDLKPSNILLDMNKTAKITDLGLSRIFASSKTYQTQILEGAHGYMPPEYLDHRLISKKFDVFSFGMTILKMVAGNTGYFCFSELSPEEFIRTVCEKWTNRLQAMPGLYSIHETDILQVNACTEIALRCVDKDRKKRPSFLDIVHKLEELEAAAESMMGSKPHHLSLHHLRGITNNFSNERILGRGGFGVVYKGVLPNGEMVAIKKLLQSTPISEEKFENEVDILMKLEHQFIVRLLGYCYETQRLHTPHEGKFVFVWNTETFLCLECVPNGSLNNYISDASSGLDWHTRFKIIEGISYGLQYLHEYFIDPIIHLDLKPANILLDENMMPKITDFGLSRLFNQNQTILTKNSCGTLGYMSPEYQLRGIITPMVDIFSLGVIIMEVITGHRDYQYDIRTSSDRFIKDELQKWRKVLLREPVGYTALETDCKQIQRCIQIGLICVNPERTKRPSMKKIVDMLQGLENMSWYITNELSSHDVQADPQSSEGDCHDN